MEDKVFQTLWNSAFEYKDKDEYIAVHKATKVKPATLDKIWEVANIPMKDLIEQAGFTQSSFACHFCIPLRNVQRWCAGDIKSSAVCVPYVRLLIARQLGML